MRRFFLLALLTYGFLVAYFYVTQRAYIFPAPPEVSVAPDDAQVLAVTTEDSTTINGWFYRPVFKERPVIVFFHGNASRFADRAEWAEQKVKQGYGVLLAGYRGYDGAEGQPTEAGLYADARAQIRWLQADGYQHLVLHGESLGTGVAVQMATEFPVEAVILESPYANLKEVAQGYLPLIPVRWLMEDTFDSIGKIAHIKAPLLIVHGTSDVVVPVTSGQALFAAATEPKEAQWLEGAGHTNLYVHGAGQIINDFLARKAPASTQ